MPPATAVGDLQRSVDRRDRLDRRRGLYRGSTATVTNGGTIHSTVTDGTHTANFALVGNFTASTFVVPCDGHGGTLVHDPKAPAVFAAAAGLAARATAVTTADLARAPPPPVLAAPS